MSCNPPINIWANNLAQRPSTNPNTNSICPTEYFYPEDEQYLDYFNKNNENPNHEIKLGFIPEPRVGNINADIFILSANPRAGLEFFCDIIDESSTGSNIINSQEKIKNLNNQNCDNFLIKLGQQWWDDNLVKIRGGFGEQMLASQDIKTVSSNQLIQIRKILSSKVCTLEFFPYYSNNFKHGHLRLPSQIYIKNVIEYAICRNKFIILNRLEKEYFGLVPSLFKYNNLYFTSKSQKTSISNNNILDRKRNKNNNISSICNQLSIYGIIP
jgi:hypothetical protein